MFNGSYWHRSNGSTLLSWHTWCKWSPAQYKGLTYDVFVESITKALKQNNKVSRKEWNASFVWLNSYMYGWCDSRCTDTCKWASVKIGWRTKHYVNRACRARKWASLAMILASTCRWHVLKSLSSMKITVSCVLSRTYTSTFTPCTKIMRLDSSDVLTATVHHPSFK